MTLLLLEKFPRLVLKREECNQSRAWKGL